MCSIEILFYLGDRDVEVEIGDMMHHQHHDEHQDIVGGILIGSKLDLHGSEFHSPSHIVVSWNLKPHWVPVCWVDHLKEGVFFLCHIIKFLVNDKELPTQQYSQVSNESIVDLNVFVL